MYAPGDGLDGDFHIFLVEIANNLGFDGFDGYCVTAAKFVHIESGHLALKFGHLAGFQREYVFFDTGRQGTSAFHTEVGPGRGG